MRTVDISEAIAQLLALLDEVEHGQEVLIARHGQVIARLVPAETVDRARITEAVAKIQELSKGQTLGGLSWKDLRDEGRR